jgi:hypothetical protein
MLSKLKSLALIKCYPLKSGWSFFEPSSEHISTSIIVSCTTRLICFIHNYSTNVDKNTIPEARFYSLPNPLAELDYINHYNS